MNIEEVVKDGDQLLTLVEAVRFLNSIGVKATEASLRTFVRDGKAPPYVRLNGWYLRFPMSGLIEFKRQRQKLTAPEPRR